MPGGNFKAKPGMTPLLSEAFAQMSIQGCRKLAKVMKTPYSDELPKKENAEGLALKFLAILKKAGIDVVEEHATTSAAASSTGKQADTQKQIDNLMMMFDALKAVMEQSATSAQASSAGTSSDEHAHAQKQIDNLMMTMNR